MKSFFLFFASSACLISSVHAQVISVQFDSNSISANGYSAGFIPDTVWSSDLTSATYFSEETTGLTNLVDSTGSTTAISETKTDDGIYHLGFPTGFQNPGDDALFKSGVFEGTPDYGGITPQTLTLTGLSIDNVYSLFVYVRDPLNNQNVIIATGGGQSYTLSTIPTGSMIAYVPGTPTSTGVVTPGNYFDFSVGGTSTFTVQLTSSTGPGSELVGFQLQRLVPLPEPSAIGLLSLGLVGAGLFAGRHRSA